jgi:hypothetical protein
MVGDGEGGLVAGNGTTTTGAGGTKILKLIVDLNEYYRQTKKKAHV